MSPDLLSPQATQAIGGSILADYSQAAPFGVGDGDDLRAKIDSDAPHEIAEIFELVLSIGAVVEQAR